MHRERLIGSSSVGWRCAGCLTFAAPVAYVFDDMYATADGKPGWYVPYFGRQPMVEDRPEDYANPNVSLKNCRTVEFLHPIGDVISALIDAGLRIDQFQENDSVAWQMFAQLKKRGLGELVWPDKPWLPLSFSLRASKC